MSIRTVRCPVCGTTANVAAAFANVKCPACNAIYNPQQPQAAASAPAAGPATAAHEDEDDASSPSGATIAMVAGLAGGAIMMTAMLVVAITVLNREPDPTASAPPVEETIKPDEPEEYRVVNLPEATRQRIYKDYRSVARTTVERPLAVPQGTKVRQDLEVMLEKTYDRELMRFAALHDISVADVQEIIKEGDAKVWDGSPRSHAVRDGKRVYSREKSEGWELNPNRK